MLDAILRHLKILVSHDTTNPPRVLHARSEVITYVSTVLESAGFAITIDDLGDGSVNVFALRGHPHYLLNVHLDTVPADGKWDGDPWSLRVESDRASALGACDIKGAAAALLTAVGSTSASAAVLFTTDEEAGQSRCVRSFLQQHPHQNSDLPNIQAVVVAEPTGGRAVTAHRGLVAAQITFTGRAGHASQADTDSKSAVHHAIKWAHAALAYVERLNTANESESAGLRFNLGKITGGTKANVVASTAEIIFGFRPTPAHHVETILNDLRALALDNKTVAEWRIRFQAPALAESIEAKQQIEQLELTSGEPVDFWTEAALFAEAGYPTIVLGPGHIAQAHTAGEWVALAQLEMAYENYRKILAE